MKKRFLLWTISIAVGFSLFQIPAAAEEGTDTAAVYEEQTVFEEPSDETVFPENETTEESADLEEAEEDTVPEDAEAEEQPEELAEEPALEEAEAEPDAVREEPEQPAEEIMPEEPEAKTQEPQTENKEPAQPDEPETEEPKLPEEPETEEPELPEEETIPEGPVSADLLGGTEEVFLDQQPESPEELFDSYVEEEIFCENKAASSSATSSGRLLGMNAKIYSTICPEVVKVAAGERTSTEFTVTVKDLGLSSVKWTAKSLGVSALRSNNAITQEALDAAGAKLSYNSTLILYTLIVERPFDLYWHDRQTGVLLTRAIQCTVSYDSQKGCDVMTLSGYLKFAHPVSPKYSAGSYKVDTTAVNKAKQAAANAKAIVNKYSSYSDYNKLKAYKTEICNLTSYNSYAAENGDSTSAHLQMIGVFDGDSSTTVVCEGYSKAFQYLCDLSTFNKSVVCKTVSGTMGSTASSDYGPHMWNIVNLGNGLNYLVDVTNCDTGSAGNPDYLFMVPYTSGSYSGGYYFQCPNQKIWYVYDSTTKALYSAAELTITGTKYNTSDESGRVNISVIYTATASDKVYTGKELKPVPKVTYNDTVLEAGKDFTYYYRNNTNVGTATVIVNGTGAYVGTVTGSFKIKPRSISGAKVTGITAKTYTGKAIRQSPIVKITISGKTYKLKKGVDYTLTYKNSKNVGYATVTIKGKGNYKESLTKKYQIRPKPTTLRSVTAGTGKMVVKWAKKTTQTSGYQIQYSLSKTFSAGNKSVLITSNKTVKRRITGLKRGKRYYVRIRTYRKVGSKKIYSTWSTAKSVLIK